MFHINIIMHKEKKMLANQQKNKQTTNLLRNLVLSVVSIGQVDNIYECLGWIDS